MLHGHFVQLPLQPPPHYHLTQLAAARGGLCRVLLLMVLLLAPLGMPADIQPALWHWPAV